MPLRETLQTILTDYAKAKSEPLEGHPLAQFIRHDAEAAVQAALGEFGTGLLVEGSPGQGQWAAVPWISVFDPAITTSATSGYYVVYLFHANQPVVHLSLNQGTTKVREEFGARALRCECLDRMLIFGVSHLRQILASYAAYYNQARTHLALQKDAPLHRAVQRSGAIVAIPILAGLHHKYVRI
jgi:hypothetical protein